MHIRSASNTNEINWDDPLNKGLVSWYSFNQKGGNVLRDVVGKYHGTLDSSMTSDDWVASPETNSLALDFDGINDDVATGVSSEGWTQLSLFCWVWAEASTQADNYASFLYNQAENVGFFQDAGINRFLVRLDTDTGATTIDFNNEDFCTGEWKHVGLTWDGASLRPHLNGQWTGFSGARTGTIDGAGQYIIGSQTGGTNFWNGKVSDVRIYDRGLSESEVRDLYQASRTGYVDQFKRRSFPVGVTPTPTESHPSNGLIRLKQNAQPSYKAGYAKSASESASPELWDGLRGAWVPQMGITGIERVLDVTGRNHGVTVGTEAGDIKPNYLHLDADGGGTYGEYMRADQQQMTLPFTLTSRARLTDPAVGMIFFSAYKLGSDSGRDYHVLSGSTDGKITINSRDQSANDTDVSVSGLFEVGEWVNVVAVFREDRHDAYLNGRHVAGGTVTAGLDADMILAGTQRLNFSAIRGTGDFSSVLYHDRELSLSEIQELNADPLAPFRQRRYAPVSLQPLTLLEKIRSVAKPTTTRALSLKKNSVPSYKAGYAKSASESAHPELWEGLANAWVPALGSSGFIIKNVVGAADADTADMESDDIQVEAPYHSISTSATGGGTYGEYARAQLTQPVSYPFSATVLWKPRSADDGGFLSFYVPNSDGSFYSLTYTAGGKVRMDTRRAGSASLFEEQDGTTSANEWHCVTACWESRYSRQLWIDGKRVLSSTASGPVEVLPTNVLIGTLRLKGAAFAADGYNASTIVHDRVLSAGEINELHADPLAPFRKKTLTIGYQPSKELRGLFRT